MSKQPKEIRDIEKQLKVTTIAVRLRSMNFSIAPQHAALICGVKARVRGMKMSGNLVDPLLVLLRRHEAANAAYDAAADSDTS
jgi:hypothetical protein